MKRETPVAMCLFLAFLGLLCQGTTFRFVEAGVRIEEGHFIRYEITINPILEGEVTLNWIKLEFTSIEGNNATIRSTMHLSDGREWDSKTTLEIASGSSTGLLIPPNTGVGDAVPIEGYGNLVIEGEAESIYTGVQRTTVFAEYSNSTETLSCAWDKPTGILLAQNSTKNEGTMLWKILDTNIWQTQHGDSQLYQTLVYVVVVAGAILAPLIYLRSRKKGSRRGRAS